MKKRKRRSDDAKGESKQTAQQYVQDVGLVSFPVGGDIADALCMGRVCVLWRLLLWEPL